MEQFNRKDNIHSTLICELRNKLNFAENNTNVFNIEDEYEIISIPQVRKSQ